MRVSLAALSTLSALALAGCGHSPATHFLVLDPVPPAAARGDYRGPPLMVPAVHVPAAIDRVEIVQEQGGGQLKINDFDKWAAPLGALMRDTLVRDLAARLPEGAVLPPGAVAPKSGAARLDVTVLAFDGSAGTLQVAWQLLRPGGGGPRRLATLSTAPAGTDAAAAAHALTALLGQLADRIATEV